MTAHPTTGLVAFAVGASLSLSILPAMAQSPNSPGQRGGVAQPQEAPVTNCDTYAATDSDPQHKAKGVPFDKINSALAIPACEGAVRQYPNSSRLIFQLGRAYSKNNDFSAALVQYRKAAEQGNVAWYRKAAEQGNAQAQTNLGFMYEKGQGVAKDEVQAFSWYRKAAEQGIATAQDSLGYMYVKGLGVQMDEAQAVAWFRRAADQGFAGAQYNLGTMYGNGRGVPKDRAQALASFRKASEQRNEAAKNKLAELEAAKNRLSLFGDDLSRSLNPPKHRRRDCRASISRYSSKRVKPSVKSPAP